MECDVGMAALMVGRSALVALLLTTFVGCVPREPPEPPLPPPPPTVAVLHEEVLTTVERPDVSISDIVETVSPDRKTVTVSGTLINRGTGATREISLQVDALRADGTVVLRTAATPTTQRLAPGTTAQFFATFEKRADVDRYHVDAVSR